MIDSFHSSGSVSFFQIEVISLWISKQIDLPPALIKYGTLLKEEEMSKAVS
jgi:hypothetical protein